MGRGVLVYVMGPSGCGKDSLLREAAGRLKTMGLEAGPIFTRRCITRPAEAGGEEHTSLSVEEFAAAREAGKFALHWESHGLYYGIDAGMDDWLAQGRTVVLNGSREYLPQAVQRYPQLIPVLITVRPEILRIRLLERGRESGEAIEARLARAPALPQVPGLITLDNSGQLEDAVRLFTDLLLEICRTGKDLEDIR